MQPITNTFPYKWWALIGLSMLSFTAFLDFTIVTTALPFIQKDLHANVLQLQWITNIFGIITAMFMIAAGKAGDMLGRKRVFYFGFIMFGIAAIGAAMSPTIQWLIFFRGVQAFAAAIIATVGVTLLPQAFPADEQDRAIGIFSAFNGAGLALGPFIGGLLITLFSWRWVFWINVPIVIVGLGLCIFSLKPSPKPDTKMPIDWLALVLLIVGLGSLIYGIIQGGQTGWSFPFSWILIAFGIIALTVLIRLEIKSTQPFLDLTLFKNPRTSLSILVCITASVVTYIFMFIDPLYLHLVRSQSAFMVGLTLVCVPIVQVAISILLKALLNKFGVFNLLLYSIAATLIAAIFHTIFTPSINIIYILIPLLLMGYTWGMANAGTITALTQSVAPEKMGSAVGTVFTLWNAFGSILLALATVIFHWQQNLAFNITMQKNTQLTQQQFQFINSMLAHPEQSQQLTDQFNNLMRNQIGKAFEFSFMHAFHCVSWFAVLIVFILFMKGLKLRRKLSRES